jgi:hypothetical protein
MKNIHRVRNLILFLVVIQLFLSTESKGQFHPEMAISNTTMIAGKGDFQPFWFWANQHGMVQQDVQLLNLTVMEIKSPREENNSQWEINWGATLAGGLSENSYWQFNQIYAGIGYRGWLLQAGNFQEASLYNRLSTTNGNLAKSLNARPYPKIRFSTNGFKPLPVLNQRLAFKAEYDEGILNDNRYVKNAKLHHKSFYLAYQPATGWTIEAGAEHFVMWGGTSPDSRYGQLPQDFKSYLRYITGSMGGDNFPETDQLNVAGNQLGTYQFKISKAFKKSDLTFYASHPFEDFSGVNFRNWPDNLLGFSVEMKDKTGFVTHFLYEYTNTRQQSINDSTYVWSESSQSWQQKPFDNYYNHGYYRSGFTYHNKMLGSPLFGPITSADGITTGIRSNRFYSHHFGMLGAINEFIAWKGLFTFSHHLGTWSQPYDEPQNQISILLEITINHPEIPFVVNLAAAADEENLTNTNAGFRLNISKSF